MCLYNSLGLLNVPASASREAYIAAAIGCASSGISLRSSIGFGRKGRPWASRTRRRRKPLRTVPINIRLAVRDTLLMSQGAGDAEIMPPPERIGLRVREVLGSIWLKTSWAFSGASPKVWDIASGRYKCRPLVLAIFAMAEPSETF